MIKMYSTVVLEDPINKNYNLLLKKVIESLKPEDKGIKIVFLTHINDSCVLNTLLTRYYSLTRKEAENAGFDYKFEINVFFNISDIKEIIGPTKEIFKLQNEKFPGLEGNIVEFNNQLIENESDTDLVEYKNNYSSENVVAVGGTFDHIHDGHKILLSMAIFLVKEKLIIGITGAQLLVNKKFASVLDSFEVRLNSVLNFVKPLLSNSIRFEIYEINDICGPTGFIPDINSLIVSEESLKGAEFVNNFRLERGFSSLNVIKINVVGDYGSNEENNWKGKLSSTDIREKEYNRLKC